MSIIMSPSDQIRHISIPCGSHGNACDSPCRLADIKPGDIVCDPMCGTGAITIEV